MEETDYKQKYEELLKKYTQLQSDYEENRPEPRSVPREIRHSNSDPRSDKHHLELRPPNSDHSHRHLDRYNSGHHTKAEQRHNEAISPSRNKGKTRQKTKKNKDKKFDIYDDVVDDAMYEDDFTPPTFGSSTLNHSYPISSVEYRLRRRYFGCIPPSDSNDIDAYDDKGRTMLINAVEAGDKNLVAELLKKPIDINKPDIAYDRTPLIWAFKTKQTSIAHMLIVNGANINVHDSNDDSNTPLHYCFRSPEFRPLIDVLLNSEDLDVNCKTTRGITPLVLAIYNKDVFYVRVLLHRGADPNLRFKSGPHPLHVACDCKCADAVQLLLNFSADVNCEDHHGMTPLHIAVRENQENIVTLLLVHKADMRIRDSNGNRPLDIAASSPKISKVLEDYDPGTKSWKHEIDPGELETFVDKKSIGSGFYGTVYHGRLHGTPCAVKSLKEINKAASDAICYEIGLMSDIHHPNILALLGTCTSSDLGQCIITEYINGGSLSEYIAEHHPLSWKTILNCAIDTARGMAWLHSRKPPILHRDLHTNNILITKGGVCKVCDFGVSQIQGGIAETKKIYKRIRPPEIVAGHAYSMASDVFMFGLVLYELLTKEKASTSNTTEAYMEVLREEIQDNEECPEMKQTFIEVMQESVNNNPNERPSFEEIIIRLESLHTDVEDRPDDLIPTRIDVRAEYI